MRHKAGHFPAEVSVKPLGRNGWGYVFRIRESLIRLRHGARGLPRLLLGEESLHLYVLEILAQVLVLVTLARRLPQKWLAFVDNVAGQWALTKRYGKDPAVNGELAAFWSTAALADCSSCAVEGQCPQRRDLEMARRMGWTRGNTPVKGILQTLARAVKDLDFAVNDAADELVNLAV